MKKLSWKSVAMLVTGLFFFACSPEQSEFTVESITTTATIRGQAYYQTGMADGISKEKIEYPTGRKVFVDVLLSVYTSSGATGNKTFETTMNEKGEFTIVIPCPKSGIMTGDITVRFESFEGQQTYASGKTENGVFKLTTNISNGTVLNPTDIWDLRERTTPLQYEFTINRKLETYDSEITVIGYISKQKIKHSASTSPTVTSVQDSTSGDSVLVTVIYSPGNITREYRLISGEKGKFEFQLPIKSKGSLVSIITEGIEKRKEDFQAYKADGGERTFAGYFEKSNNGGISSLTLSPIQKSVILNACTMIISVDPNPAYSSGGASSIFDQYGFTKNADNRYYY